MRELELKFGVHASFTVPAFDEEPSGVAQMEKLPSQDLRATYYDTEDLRLARDRITLRYRRGEEGGPRWTLKLPVRGSSLVHRDEHDFAPVGRRVPAEARSLVTAYVRTASLDPVATIHTKRRRWALRSDDRELAELVDDEVSVLEGRKVVSRFRELEIEAREASITELERIAEVLRSAGATDLEPIPKAVRAMGPRATAAPDPVVDPKVGPDEPAANAVQAALVRGVRRLIEHDSETRLGEPEGVHQMRVAARRLRSDLRTFEVVLDPAWVETLTIDLKWLAKLLGGVRDMDVLLDRLHRDANDLEGDLKPLFHALEGQREVKREALMSGLTGDRFPAMLDRLMEAAAAPGLTEQASAPAAEILLAPVAATWKELSPLARKLDESSADDDYHTVRIYAKRTRYASEAVIEVFGKEAKRYASAAADVQDVLGEHQDAIVARDAILEIARADEESVDLHLAAGRLAERQDHAARRARARFTSVWSDIDRKKTRGWLTH